MSRNWDWQPIATAPKDRPIVVCDGVGGIHSVRWQKNSWFAFNGGWIPSASHWDEYPRLPWQKPEVPTIIDIGVDPDAILEIPANTIVKFEDCEYQLVASAGFADCIYFTRVDSGWDERRKRGETEKLAKVAYSEFFRHIRIPKIIGTDRRNWTPASNTRQEFVEAVKNGTALGDA